MYKPQMKSLVKYVMGLDLVGLKTREGYNGAPILTTTFNNHHADLLQGFAKNIAKEIDRYQEDRDKDGNILIKLSAVFGKDTVDNIIYHIKE